MEVCFRERGKPVNPLTFGDLPNCEKRWGHKIDDPLLGDLPLCPKRCEPYLTGARRHRSQSRPIDRAARAMEARGFLCDAFVAAATASYDDFRQGLTSYRFKAIWIGRIAA